MHHRGKWGNEGKQNSPFVKTGYVCLLPHEVPNPDKIQSYLCVYFKENKYN